MTTFARVTLNKGKESSLLRRHPWVFSGAIRRIDGEVAEGDFVEVFSYGGDFLGTGYYQPGGSIAVRIFSFERVNPDYEFWKIKIQKAFAFRQKLGFDQNTNVYRLFFAEGDGLAGLV